MQYRRLPLDGLYNARDLGGYPITGGGVTQYNKFIRCEAPRALSERDFEYLKAIGITLNIDFRGDSEIERNPNCFAALPWIEHRRHVTFNEQVAHAARRPEEKGEPPSAFVDWRELYVKMAEDCKSWVRDTLCAMADTHGGVIYNCTTGKDRTGMISALLLGLADVAAADIIADYCVSEVYLTDVYLELLREHNERRPNERADIESPAFKTSPRNMRALLEHYAAEYGGIPGYVASCGVPSGVSSELRRRLTGV